MLCGRFGCAGFASVALAEPAFKSVEAASGPIVGEEIHAEDSIELHDMDADQPSPQQRTKENTLEFVTNALEVASTPVEKPPRENSGIESVEAELPPTVVISPARPNTRVSSVPSRKLSKPAKSLRVINVSDHFLQSMEDDVSPSELGTSPPSAEKRMLPQSNPGFRYLQSIQEASAAYPIPSVPRRGLFPSSLPPIQPASDAAQAFHNAEVQEVTRLQNDSSAMGPDYHAHRQHDAPRSASQLNPPETCESPTIGSPRGSFDQYNGDFNRARTMRPTSPLTADLLSPRASFMDAQMPWPPVLPAEPPPVNYSTDVEIPLREVAPDGFPLPPQPLKRDWGDGVSPLPVPPRRRRGLTSSRQRASPDALMAKFPNGSMAPGTEGMAPGSRARPGTAPVQNLSGMSHLAREVVGVSLEQPTRRPASQQRPRQRPESQRPWRHVSMQRASSRGVEGPLIIMEGAIMQPAHARPSSGYQQAVLA